MKVLNNKNSLIEKLIESPAYIEDTEYKVSAFCRFSEDGENGILFNTFTKELILLDGAEKEKFLSLSDSDFNGFLVKNHFLVKKDLNEQEFCDNCLKTLDLIGSKNYIDSFVILPTTDCNARCYYCYELGVKRTNMTDGTARDVADYIIKASKGNPVTIKWFGGEPLYNMNAIDIICAKLIENGTEYSTRMISNGYLFDEKTVEKAKSLWHLKRVQITLDGTREIYNKTKAYIYKDTDAFSVVIKNIKHLIKNKILVNIRLNVSEKNAEDILGLCSYLSSEFSENKEYLTVYPATLFDLKHERSCEEQAENTERYNKISAFLREKGLKKDSISPFFSLGRGCMAQNKSSVVITPDGKLGRCEHFSEGDKLYGSIKDAKINEKAYYYWEEKRRTDLCKECPLYPNCYGITHCPDLAENCDKQRMESRISSLDAAIKQFVKKKG